MLLTYDQVRMMAQDLAAAAGLVLISPERAAAIIERTLRVLNSRLDENHRAELQPRRETGVRLCDACESQPAMMTYRNTSTGAVYQWCRDCSARIVRPEYGLGYDLVGPADNVEARVEFARGIVHLQVNDLLESVSLPAAIEALEGAITIPDYVRSVAAEVREAEPELVNAAWRETP